MICVNICKPLFNSKPGAPVFHTFPYICRVFGSEGECPARLKGNRVRLSDSPAAVCQRPLWASPARRVGHDARHDAIALCARRRLRRGWRARRPAKFFRVPPAGAAMRSMLLYGAPGPRVRRVRRVGGRIGAGPADWAGVEVAPRGAVVRLSRLRARRALFPFRLFPPPPPPVFLPWRFVRLPLVSARVRRGQLIYTTILRDEETLPFCRVPGPARHCYLL